LIKFFGVGQSAMEILLKQNAQLEKEITRLCAELGTYLLFILI
jgi:hypothetical protein